MTLDLVEEEPRAATAPPRPVTKALLAANVALFLLEELWGGSTSLDTLVRMGAVFSRTSPVFDWTRCLAYGYLHIGPIHLIMNMTALWVMGSMIEPMLGSARFFVLYTGAVVGGGATVALFGGDSITAGASGGLFGLLGAEVGIFLLLARRARSPSEREAMKQQILRILVPNVLISLVPGVSFLGHAGGFAVGFGFFALGLHRWPQVVRARGGNVEVVSDPVFRALALVLLLLTVASIGSIFWTFEPFRAVPAVPR
ncbi:MAG: rhomboid family intramembrane serine protease [Polyangiales bacterium]